MDMPEPYGFEEITCRKIEETQSVCPVCLRTIPARRVRRGDDMLLTKECPEHGNFETVFWRGTDPEYQLWESPKTPSRPLLCQTESAGDCPHDCGLCPDHRQHTCTALLEITQRCNLRCPVCFASAGDAIAPDPDIGTIGFWYDRALESGRCNIQLSGGEPTLRPDLPEIIELGRRKGFDFIQLNTNGLLLAENPDYARTLRGAGLASVFLQFDGLSDAAQIILRGRPLSREKKLAIEHCAAAGLGVVLVPTLVRGANDHEIGDILRFALAQGAAVRGVHFQPMSHFGRYPSPPSDANRITLPEIMRALEDQSGGLVHVKDFRPPGCEHELCSFHANYLRTAEGLLPLSQARRCCPEPKIPAAAQGAARSITYTARQWAGTADCGCRAPEQTSLSLDQVRTWNFSLSAMAFQDAWNLDLERLRGCCIHVVAPDGRLVPFCAFNLTSARGEPLYRKPA